jgi:hypothetical protein
MSAMRRRGRSRLSRAVLLGAAAAALAITAVALSGGTGPEPRPGGRGEPGMVHVHGLGIDPAEETLYVATHHGLFRLPADGGPQRVGDAMHDLMGFTVAGPGRFLASGHPDPFDDTLRVPDAPPLLGLIETTDAGHSWEPLSLLGEADFHALTVAHGRIYAHDATTGRFMTSADGRTWATHSSPGPNVTALAVDPADPEVILAAGPTGLRRTDDGGNRWTAVDAPPLVLLSWDDDTEQLWGADPNGRLWSSANGTGWATAATTPGGRPEALLAQHGQVWLATSTGVHHSPDATTWTTLHHAQR